MQKNSPLYPYLNCKCLDDLNMVQINGQSPNSPKFREIQKNLNTTDTISVLEGYRIMYAFQNTDYFFANVKVEQSDSINFNDDKSKLIESGKYLAASDFSATVHFQDTLKLNGYQILSQEKSEIDNGAVIGVYTIFSDSDHVIITIYLLNQEQDHRRFNNRDEYQKLREDFLRNFSDCIKMNKSKRPVSST